MYKKLLRLKIDSKNIQALNGIATCMFMNHDLTESEAKLKMALNVDPHDPQTKAYAIVQLRQDNKLGTLFNMVGFQT